MRVVQSGSPTDFQEWVGSRKKKTRPFSVSWAKDFSKQKYRTSNRLVNRYMSQKGKHSVWYQGDKRSGLNVGLGSTHLNEPWCGALVQEIPSSKDQEWFSCTFEPVQNILQLHFSPIVAFGRTAGSKYQGFHEAGTLHGITGHLVGVTATFPCIPSCPPCYLQVHCGIAVALAPNGLMRQCSSETGLHAGKCPLSGGCSGAKVPDI